VLFLSDGGMGHYEDPVAVWGFACWIRGADSGMVSHCGSIGRMIGFSLFSESSS